VLNDDLPESVRELFTACRLLALPKHEGGVRPIALGDLFLKCASVVALEQLRPALAEIFNGLQFGALSKGGAVIDFTVLYPLATTNLLTEQKELGGSIKKASEAKHNHYAGHCKEYQQFVTFGVSSFGFFSQEALNCVAALSQHTEHPASFRQELMRALVIAVHRGNARLSLN
jgi:hypothetical protein